MSTSELLRRMSEASIGLLRCNPCSKKEAKNMDELPQVGQKYQHKKWGEVIVQQLHKLGRGHRVYFYPNREQITVHLCWTTLKDFQKATK